MKIPLRTHYAIKILVDLATRTAEQPSTVAEIAARQGIPKQFLHQILLGLKSGGMVRSRRGLNGGYIIAGAPAEMSVASVVKVIHGELFVPPQDEAACRSGLDLAIRELWSAVGTRMEAELKAVTIRDMCRRASEKKKTADYVI